MIQFQAVDQKWWLPLCCCCCQDLPVSMQLQQKLNTAPCRRPRLRLTLFQMLFQPHNKRCFVLRLLSCVLLFKQRYVSNKWQENLFVSLLVKCLCLSLITNASYPPPLFTVVRLLHLSTSFLLSCIEAAFPSTASPRQSRTEKKKNGFSFFFFLQPIACVFTPGPAFNQRRSSW